MPKRRRVRLQPNTSGMPSASATGLSALRRVPGLKFLLVQALAVVLWLALVQPLLGVALAPVSQALGVGLMAALLGWLWHLPRWWLPINILFVPGLVAMLSLTLAPHWYLIAFMVLLLVYWSAARGQVPLYLSSREAWQAVAERIPPSSVVVDLGSGLGGLLRFLARQRPDGTYVGMETAPLPFLASWLRAWLGGMRYEIRWSSLWNADLRAFDVVYAYLSPVPMARLWGKVQAEMRPGSLFISNTFQVPGVEPAEVVQLDDLHHSRLYLYRL